MYYSCRHFVMLRYSCCFCSRNVFLFAQWHIPYQELENEKEKRVKEKNEWKWEKGQRHSLNVVVA